MELSSKILSDITVFMKYAKFLPEKNRRENWNELVDRNKEMHIEKYPHLKDEIESAYKFVYEKKLLPSMRSFQFAGKPIEINNTRLYNCCFLPVEHIDSFSEVMFLLLSGTGVGYSVQRHHVEKLPEINKPTKTRRYLVGDSIEGWADAVKVMMSAYMKGKALPVYDFSDIRPKGAQLITSGGKAPGPEPLKDCLHNIRKILDRKENGEKLTTLEVHDILCYIADAVLAGGIRRSAMIALFDLDDEDMLTCKFGNWWEFAPQRSRANNSAVILRHKIDKETFLNLWKKIEASNSGEPGFLFTNDKEWGMNPCAEISLRPYQFCNLTTINAGNVIDQADLNARAKAAAFIGTLQASYTNFHYLRDIWKKTTEKEALIGVSMTGIAAGTVLGLDMTEAANVVKQENARVAKLIGTNPAARSTTVKPEGTSSLVLGTSSGIHAWHNDHYIRRVRVGKNEAIYQYLSLEHPELLEDEFLKPNQQAVISVPQKAPEGAVTRQERALDLLARVSKVWNDWVKAGHRKGANYNNVSTTVSIKNDEWEEVGDWMWDNRENFTALSVLPYNDHSYVQAPFEDITEEQFNRLVSSLHEINLDDVIETVDNTNLQGEVACGGNSSNIGDSSKPNVGCEVT
jgi:ribonucleoside-diphosphate reductase alpha chain